MDRVVAIRNSPALRSGFCRSGFNVEVVVGMPGSQCCQHVLLGHVRVALGCGDGRVTKDFLHDPYIRPNPRHLYYHCCIGRWRARIFLRPYRTKRENHMNDDEQDWAAVSPLGFRVTLDEKSKVGSSQVKSTLLGPEVRILRGEPLGLQPLPCTTPHLVLP